MKQSLLCLTLLLCTCGRPANVARITVTGSSTVAPLLAAIASRYQASRPLLQIDVQTGGSSRGVSDVRNGLAQIGMISRAPKPEETDLKTVTLARDGVCMILNSQNPITTLTADQVRAIYRGQITRWNQVGGPDQPITVVHKAEGRSTLELFLDYFDLKATEVQAHVIIGDNAQGLKLVAGNPDAIAYVSVGAAETEQRLGAPIRLLPLDGVTPNQKTLGDGQFPLSRPLNLVTSGPLSAEVAAFLEYAVSPAVTDLIEEHSFVPARR